MKTSVLTAALLLACQFIAAQLPQSFSGLTEEVLTNGYFLPLSGKLSIPPNGSGNDTLTANTAQNAVHALHKSAMSSNTIPSIIDLLNASRAAKANTNSIPLNIFDINYTDLHPNAYEEGWVATIDDVVTDLTDADTNPYVTNRGFTFFIDWDHYLPGTYAVILPTDGIHSNVSGDFSSLSIDFDDGLGFRGLTPGVPLTVVYDDSGIDRTIRLQAQKGGSTLNANYQMRAMTCSSGIPEPEPAPWPAESEEMPWRISTQFNGTTVRGNAYTLMSEDGVFDKPFIFIEGIDFGLDVSRLRNGSFGWNEFACGASENYPFMERMPDLLMPLRDAGYDLILLDFEDGADFIELNSELLIHLIELVNEYKVGSEELIVSGASMGGQISRIALRKMELAGTPHCTRLWISMDSPHCGANVPYGLQTTLQFLASYNAQAEVFLELFLKRPAARELLLAQLPSSGSLHAGYMNFLNNLGYPETTRNIGIANGNINGIPLSFADGAHLLDFNCEIASINLLKLLVIATGGDPFNANSTETLNVISHSRYTQTESCSSFWECLFGPIVSIATYHSIAYVPNTFPRLDNAPGGTRTSIVQMVEALNETLAELSGSNQYPGACSSEISEGQYIAEHSFIPTTSALGIQGTSLYLNVAEAVANNPSLTPFDRIYGVPGTNTEHSEITPAMIDLVLEEVIGGGYNPGVSVNENGTFTDTFNYGAWPEQIIYDLHVADGGVLLVNAMAPLNAGIDPLWLPNPNSLNIVRTSACGAVVEIGDNGSLKIGDGAYGLTGRMEIRPGSALRLFEGGSILIDEQSELVIQNGATFTIDGGSFDAMNGARLIIEPGAILEFKGGDPMQFFGIESSLDLYGQIVLDDGVTLELVMAGEEGGKLRCMADGISVQGGLTSSLVVRGAGMHDAMIEVFPGAELRTAPGFGALRLRDGRVNLHHDAAIVSAGQFNTWNTALFGAEDGSELKSYSTTSYNESELHGLNVICEPGNRTLHVNRSTLTKANIWQAGGRLRITESEFNQCGVQSNDLAFNSRIIRSVFNGPGTAFPAAISDASQPRILCEESSFTNYQRAIGKSFGELVLRCNSFESCNEAVYGGLYALINLSTWYGGGHNTFTNNTFNIMLHTAFGLKLVSGYNSFGTAASHVIAGSMLGVCDADCNYEINATGNAWPTVDGAPEFFLFDLTIIGPPCGTAIPKPDDCKATIIDRRPNPGIGCPERPLVFHPIRNRSMAAGLGLNEVNVLEALGRIQQPYADENSVDDLVARIEALTSVLNNTGAINEGFNTDIALGAANALQNFIEDLIVLDPENAIIAEGLAALNHLATGDFSVHRHRMRVQLEAIKSHLMEIMGYVNTAEQLLLEASDCGVGPDAALLNTEHVQGIERRAARVAHNNQHGGGMPFNFTPTPVDIDALPVVCAGSFGAWLHAPGEVSFPICMPANTNAFAEDAVVDTRLKSRLAPNPASDHTELTWLSEDNDDVTVRCAHVWGSLCFEDRVSLRSGERLRLNVADLAPGLYFITLSGDWGTEVHRLMVQ